MNRALRQRTPRKIEAKIYWHEMTGTIQRSPIDLFNLKEGGIVRSIFLPIVSAAHMIRTASFGGSRTELARRCNCAGLCPASGTDATRESVFCDCRIHLKSFFLFSFFSSRLAITTWTWAGFALTRGWSKHAANQEVQKSNKAPLPVAAQRPCRMDCVTFCNQFELFEAHKTKRWIFRVFRRRS